MTPKNFHEKPRTTSQYWDENWRRHAGNKAGQLIDYNASYFWRRIDRSLARIFGRIESQARQLIEIGAGASEWLPYLHDRFGFTVSGLDYSEIGCQRAKINLATAGSSGAIYQADMFSPPEELLENFDVVVSFGVIEHFEDTTAALAACARYVRPGGVVVTMIPNMKGLYGWLYRLFDRKVFDIHVPLDLSDLTEAHRRAGLTLESGEYLLGLPGVIDRARIEPVLWRRFARMIMFWLSAVYWWAEEHGFGIRENRFTSPYLLCSAVKPKLDE